MELMTTVFKLMNAKRTGRWKALLQKAVHQTAWRNLALRKVPMRNVALRNVALRNVAVRNVAVHKCAQLSALALLLGPLHSSYAQTPDIDPWQAFNRPVFHFNRAVDGVVIKPIALGYQRFLPAQAKTGVRNFFNNIDDVNVLVNDLLQLKMQQALNDSGRLLLNSTVGLGGIFDVGERMGLLKNYEDFGQTLGYWGVGDGGYLMLPILGSSTLRDAVGSVPDYLLNPLRLVTDSKVRTSLLVLDMVDTRVGYLSAEVLIRGDEYSFVRNAYMQRREYLVADGMVQDEFDDF
jgi:phospholipid-binding lipoprotein MlaA